MDSGSTSARATAAALLRLTSKMSHDRGWRAACGMTIWSLRFHFEIREIARGVTAMVVGSGALFGVLLACDRALGATLTLEVRCRVRPSFLPVWSRYPRF